MRIFVEELLEFLVLVLVFILMLLMVCLLVCVLVLCIRVVFVFILIGLIEFFVLVLWLCFVVELLVELGDIFYKVDDLSGLISWCYIWIDEIVFLFGIIEDFE